MVEINVPGFAGGELLGRGGFGSVYRASDETHGRDVAIKILDGDLGEEERRRFDRERASMGALGAHPNIVPVFDSGYTEDGRAYLVMEYAAGDSLRRRMDAKGPLGWAEAVSTMAAVARGVAAAHDAGILHRDIKPDNILIDSYGNPKLADFGIATVVSGATTTKGASTTLAHAAPELLEGQPAATTMDVYALGSTLHNLITGSPPFARPGDELAAPMLRRILSEPPPDLAELGVPAAVAAVVAKALEKAPADRHESAGAFADALERAAADAAVQANAGSGAPVGAAPDGAAPTIASHDAAASLAPSLDPASPELLADAGSSATTDQSRRGRVGLLVAIPAVAIVAAVGGVLLSNSGDDDSVEPTDTEVAGPTITSTSTTATTTSGAAAERISVSVECPDEIAVGEKIVCSIDSVGATEGSWEIPGFTSERVELDTVPGSNSIFVEPTDPAFIGTTFTLRVTVTGIDGDQATTSHRFDVVAGDDTAGGSTATTAVTRRTSAPTTAAPTTAAPTTAAPTTAAPTTAAPTTAAPTTAAPAPSVSINCPGAIKLNTSITCEIVSANASSGSWSLPGFFGGSLALSVPGSNPVFINPTNPEVVGRTFTISATVQGADGQSASTSRSFTVTE